MLNRQTPVNPDHAARFARHLGLPDDYFAEAREANVINAIRANAKLRDSIYFDHVRKRRP
jgi:hypothetical protein